MGTYAAGVRQTPATPTRVRLLGSFAIETGDECLAEADLGSRKARNLLKLLALRRGSLVPMDTIIDVLWGGEPPAKAVENVATLVSRLRLVLGADVIDGGRPGYRLALPAGCQVDLDEAERLVLEGENRLTAGQPALAETASTRALEILGFGRLLAREGAEPWVEEAGRETGRLLRRARALGWRSRFALGDHRGALAVSQQAVEADSFDEEAHRGVMLGYYRLGPPCGFRAMRSARRT